MLRQLAMAAFLAGATLLAVFVSTMHNVWAVPPQSTTVAHALSATTASERHRLAVIARVQPSSRQYDEGEWRFVLVQGSDSLTVRYKGIIPSTFLEDDAVVRVTGSMDGRTFVATALEVRM